MKCKVESTECYRPVLHRPWKLRTLLGGRGHRPGGVGPVVWVGAESGPRTSRSK